MVTTTQDDGKYLTKTWQTMREKALLDQGDFTDEELEWLEVTDEPTIGAHYPKNFEVPYNPVDPNARSIGKKLNLLDDPKHG